MVENLKYILQALDSKIDASRQNEIFEIHRKALDWEETELLPLTISFPFPATAPFQPFPHREIFDSPEKMLYNELLHAFGTSIFLHSEINDDLPYTIRANFGTVVIASLFGGKVEQRDDNPPWVRHFESQEEFKTIFDRDPHDFTQGICPQIIAWYKFYRDVLADYPNLQQCIKIVLPDLQGPLDSLELLRGSQIYSDFILEPEMIAKGLKLMAEAQVGFAKYLQQFTTDKTNGFSFQHATAIKGDMLIRNDSAIMISPEMYADQVASYDEFVLRELGGGGIHSCGKIDFCIPEIFKNPSLQCFDFGQSYLNDVDLVYSLAKEKEIPLLRIRPEKEELISGKTKERYPTGVSLVYDADSFEEAVYVTKKYYNK